MINEFHVINEKRCKIFVYIFLTKLIVLLLYFGLANATWYDNRPAATGSAQTVENDKAASNLMHIKQAVMTNTAYYSTTLSKWYQGWDNADPSIMRVNRLMAENGTPTVDYNPTWGFSYINYSSNTPKFCTYNPVSAAYECITTGSSSGVSGVKTNGNSYSTSGNYVNLGFNATQAEVGSTTFITPTSFYDEYREINIDSVKGGNTYSPTENYYGASDDYLGAWAMEFSTSVTDTVNYAWNIPEDMDTTADHYIMVDAFVPAKHTLANTNTFRMALDSAYFSHEVVHEISPNAWTVRKSTQTPIGYCVQFPITVTAANFNADQKYPVSYAFYRKVYTGDLTTTVNITNLKLKYKRD